MDKSLKILTAISMAAALLLLGSAVVLADTDGFVVHCAPMSFVGANIGDCDDFHTTIQAAVNHAEAGETVLLGVWTFDEQVTIDKPLTLEGEGTSLTSIKPLTVAANSSSLFSGAPIAAILLVDGTAGVAVSDLTIDGLPAGSLFACSPGYVGIFYRAASGAIQDTV